MSTYTATDDAQDAGLPGFLCFCPTLDNRNNWMNLGSKMNFVKATKAEIFAYVETFSLVIAVQTVNEAAVSG